MNAATRALRSVSLITILSLVLPSAALRAGDIAVSPGPGAIGAALNSAREGDTLLLAAGEYQESIELPTGVSIVGAGAEKTTLIGTGYAVINCRGRHIKITDLTIKGADETVRGVNSNEPVRVERCRFVGLREAVALMTAPLSDVVACEFIDCGIGVRAIGGASPTVWGCAFKGGNIGVFAMDGSPYIRNNCFVGMKAGIRMVPADAQPPIVRNNVFARCDTAGIEVLVGRRPPISPASIRNSIFVDCGAAVVGSKESLLGTSHAVFHGIADPAVRTQEGTSAVDAQAACIWNADPGLSIGESFTMVIEREEHCNGRGIRLCSEAPGTTGTIGLEPAWRSVGIGTQAALPAPRFGGERLIANSVSEQYQYLQVLGRRSSAQSTGNENGVRVDRQVFTDGREPTELVFDISRFYGEMGLQP